MRRSEAPSVLTTRLRWPRRSARLRLTALYGGFFLLSGAVLIAVTFVLFERATSYTTPHLPKIPQTPAIEDLPSLPPLAQAQHQLAQAQQQLTQALPAPGGGLPAARSANPLTSAGRPPLAQVEQHLAQAYRQLTLGPHGLNLPLSALADAQHQVATAVRQLARARPQLAQAQSQLAQAQRQLAQAGHQLAQAVQQVARAGSLQAAQRASDSHQLLVNSGIALVIVTLLALLAGWAVAGRMLRPIRTITRTARRISSTSLHERLALDGPQDELKELGDTLDDLFARLEAAFEAQRHFVANASHELRTPLTRERTLVQVALGDPSTPEVWRATAEELLASNRAQETLIEALLTLASSEGGLDHREPADLADICRAALARARRAGEHLGLQVRCDISPAPLECDPRLVERLVANLVDNAVLHNVAGGAVQVTTGVSDGKAVLTVANTGPVVPPSELDRLFQPFQRLDDRRTQHQTGVGLGLSIVRAIATAHGASVAASAKPEGGICIEITFRAPENLEGLAEPARSGRAAPA